MNHQPKPIAASVNCFALGRIVRAACALLVLACAAEAKQTKTPVATRPVRVAKANGRQASAVSEPAPAKYGPFTIKNIGRVEYEDKIKSNTIDIKMDGPNLAALSSRYDISAPHIDLVLIRTGKPRRPHTKSGVATGRVTVVFRNPDPETGEITNKETTTITCDKAVYTATDAANELGILRMTGNVHSVRRSRDYGDTPLVQDWTAATVEFVDAQTTRFVGENGNINGAIKEPAPRPKTNAPAGAPKQ